jgi:ubiquinone/menaquinone biosynthesis C-methylase UbiE
MDRENAILNMRAFEALALRPTEAVLEVGFGTGCLLMRICAVANDGFVAGVDTSSWCVRRARFRVRMYGAIDVQLGSMRALPYTDARFDAVIAVNTVYFWDPPGTCFQEVFRVLRPGGRLVLGFEPPESLPVQDTATGFRLRTVKMISTLCEGAGFARVTRMQRDEGSYGNIVVCAVKPSVERVA